MLSGLNFTTPIEQHFLYALFYVLGCACQLSEEVDMPF